MWDQLVELDWCKSKTDNPINITVECHLRLRIAENAVINGDLVGEIMGNNQQQNNCQDAKTFLPKCSMNGIIGIL